MEERKLSSKLVLTVNIMTRIIRNGGLLFTEKSRKNRVKI